MTLSPFHCGAIAAAALHSIALAADGVEFFEKKVRPILVERCLECHSTETKVKGGLALNTRAGWEAGGDSGPAIVPGKPEESLLIKAVRYTDPDLQMPEKRKLPDAEIATLEEWVRVGAPDPRTGAGVAKRQEGLSVKEGRKFWAYTAPQKPAVPQVRNRAWPRNAIDHFILAKLEAANLGPGSDAAPESLARRLSYNLVGLPPREGLAENVARHGVTKAAEELLATPHFGEQWGRHWLDVARFAESSGGGRTLLFKDAWKYRDYVIESLNADVPYDRFLREQVAGDLLPYDSAAQRNRQLTATGFLALGPTNYEEQDKQQLRFDVIDEQLDTIGKAVLGQTVGCARCHDHKFDPIPQRDYYALAGIFASTRTLFNYTDNVARWVEVPVMLEPDAESKLLAHERKVGELRAAIEAAKKERRGLANSDIGPVEVSKLGGIVVDDVDAKVVGSWKLSTHVKTYVGSGYRADEADGKGAKTVTYVPKFPKAGRYEVRLAYTPGASRAKAVPVHILHADGEDEKFVNQRETPPIDGRFVSLGTYRFEQDGAGYVLISNEGTEGHVIADAVQFLPEEEAAASAQAPAGTAEAAGPTLKQLEANLKALIEQGPKRPAVMSVRVDKGDIADTHIRVRGMVHQKGELVPRGFLTVFENTKAGSIPAGECGRRELAVWLTERENPLTARVFVNRVWHWLFGQGLVRTVDNFGTTGEPPSHPELLDYLAVEFMEHGWSLKWLVREIVSSRSWQLAVGHESKDPDNRLLSHANRRRLTAEQIRDTLLAASGELDLRILGPNIAGAGEINANDTSAQNVEYRYEFKDVRRSVYTPAFRAKRLELFEVFDFGNINSSMGMRASSTVAPQALYLLNHPWVLERARRGAERSLSASASDEERLGRAARIVWGREPTEVEREKFLSFVSNHPNRNEAWAHVWQTLFASVDFRYID